MDKRYYHVRKDGVSALDRNLMFMICNNGVKCNWKGLIDLVCFQDIIRDIKFVFLFICFIAHLYIVGKLVMKNRRLTQKDVDFFNPEYYEEISIDDTEDHSDECLQNAHQRFHSTN